ncbi:MAG: XdhC/CoxI family protein, partial [Cyanobacteria bacterium P01_D01_bin.2]
VGAKMLIGADWSFDTIGGGAGEAKIITQGRAVLATGEKQRATIDLTGDVSTLKEGICGGQMGIWLERWSGPEALTLAQALAQALERGERVSLFTPFTTASTPGIPESPPTTTETQLLATGFFEWLSPRPLLLIVGAGHVGEALARAAYLAGFQIAVQDEREEFANARSYPQASLILTAPIDRALRRVKRYESLFVALVSRGYPLDVAALSSIFQQEIVCCYIGMMGSRKRIELVRQSLLRLGISEAQLDQIHAPIGTDIGALTPGEIAVSICAELIQVRRTAKPRFDR